MLEDEVLLLLARPTKRCCKTKAHYLCHGQRMNIIVYSILMYIILIQIQILNIELVYIKYIYICILYGVCIWHPFDILHHFVPRWSSTSSCSKECQDLGWGVVSWISSGGVDTQKPTMSPDSQHNSWLNLTKPHPRGSRGECTLLHILH